MFPHSIRTETDRRNDAPATVIASDVEMCAGFNATVDAPHGVTAIVAPPLPARALTGCAVLLAADGSASADAATHVAHGIAMQHQAVIHALGVLDHRSAPVQPTLDRSLGSTGATAGDSVQHEQEEALRARIAVTVHRTVDWPVRLSLGTPANAIVGEARRIRAALIVLGLKRHHIVDRGVEDETVISVIRRSTCPVLGIAVGQSELPTRVLVAVDFSRASLEAAHVARDLVAPGGELVLAYVTPAMPWSADDGEAVIHEAGVAASFAQFEAALAGTVHLEHVVLHHGHPSSVARLLLDYAETVHIGLIATGSARHGRVERWMLGSVSTELARDGRFSILVIPPPQQQEMS